MIQELHAHIEQYTFLNYHYIWFKKYIHKEQCTSTYVIFLHMIYLFKHEFLNFSRTLYLCIQPEGDNGGEGEKEKDEGRVKSVKVLKMLQVLKVCLLAK